MKARLYIFALLAFSILTIAAASPQKPYTILIYLNGSDLESDFGLATDDLAEIIDSGLMHQNANLLILTGGTNRWHNQGIPETETILWEFVNGQFNEVKSMGKVSMGNPETLADFITYSVANYPAQKYGLIMWDHGGGSIVGFGHDEKFNNDSLTLLEIIQAFEMATMPKLEFLGFDACLMATVEMAVLAQDYAKTLIASEDLEPGDGWDYRFLSILNQDPHISGEALGKVIVDSFMDFFPPDTQEILNLSVVDLAHANAVMNALGELMASAVAQMEHNFNTLARLRSFTKTFGEGSPRDNYSDMVDLGDMAVMLQELFPTEAAALLNALETAVVYNRNNSEIPVWGLSTFYIYGGKSIGKNSLQTYATLNMDQAYTIYLNKFFTKLLNPNEEIASTELALLQPIAKGIYQKQGLAQELNTGLWPKINGHHAILFPVAVTQNVTQYATPAMVNGEDVDIIIASSNGHTTILGYREINNPIQKGHDPILPGDLVRMYYLNWEAATGHTTWVLGDGFVVKDLALTWETASPRQVLAHYHTALCGRSWLVTKP